MTYFEQEETKREIKKRLEQLAENYWAKKGEKNPFTPMEKETPIVVSSSYYINTIDHSRSYKEDSATLKARLDKNIEKLNFKKKHQLSLVNKYIQKIQTICLSSFPLSTKQMDDCKTLVEKMTKSLKAATDTGASSFEEREENRIYRVMWKTFEESSKLYILQKNLTRQEKIQRTLKALGGIDEEGNPVCSKKEEIVIYKEEYKPFTKELCQKWVKDIREIEEPKIQDFLLGRIEKLSKYSSINVHEQIFMTKKDRAAVDNREDNIEKGENRRLRQELEKRGIEISPKEESRAQIFWKDTIMEQLKYLVNHGYHEEKMYQLQQDLWAYESKFSKTAEVAYKKSPIQDVKKLMKQIEKQSKFQLDKTNVKQYIDRARDSRSMMESFVPTTDEEKIEFQKVQAYLSIYNSVAKEGGSFEEIERRYTSKWNRIDFDHILSKSPINIIINSSKNNQTPPPVGPSINKPGSTENTNAQPQKFNSGPSVGSILGVLSTVYPPETIQRIIDEANKVEQNIDPITTSHNHSK